MRQRLSSEPDRYRGRRRVPTPPRGRYAAVGVSAVVGAGFVALGAAQGMPDTKAIDPSMVAALQQGSITQDVAARGAADRASRGGDQVRGEVADERTVAEIEAQAWRMPLDDFTFTAPFGYYPNTNTEHPGIDLAAREGTPYKAVSSGTVTKAGYDGGYGFSITIKDNDGTETVYGHSSELLVQAGQKVTAGQVIGRVGSTGHAWGTHLHLEVHRADGVPVDPIPFLRDRGVDIKLQVETAYS